LPLLALGGDVPVDVGRDEAREAAQRELADPVYRAAEPSFVDRVLGWILRRLSELVGAAASIVPGGPFGLIVLALVAVLIVVIVRLRTGPIARTRRAGAAVFEGRRRSADDHRRAADAAASRGDLAEAVRERFRAIVRELEQRGVLDEVSGRTVDEIAARAGAALPDSAGELSGAARLFDDVVYGGRPATVDGYARLVALDDRVRHERPALVSP
jgi:Domain of unknown function (DUF4129)